MNIQEAKEILKTHNEWRKGSDEKEMTSPKKISEAIDILVQYVENEISNFPVKKVCFFKIENGKYLTDNGMEITNDMLIKHSHYIGFPWSYIVLE